MAQSLSKILLHLVFSTKERMDIIPLELGGELHGYVSTICRAQGGEAFRVGGTSNHVHVACSLPRTLSVADLLEELKRSSSAWIKRRDARCSNFSWQAGYGAFSLGQSQLDALVRYIEAQEAHHKKITFQEEYLAFLQKYKVEHDERYLWE